MKAIIVSDDLTGVADCAAAIWPHATTIGQLCDSESPPAIDLVDLERAGAVGLDLELRSLPSRDASLRLRSCLPIVAQLLDRDRELILYLKLDSALRGHIGSVVRIASETLGVPRIPVVLANPVAGRTTLEGRQYAHERLLHETGFARDPSHPTRTSSIVELLASAGVSSVAGSTAELEKWVAAECDAKDVVASAFVPDVTTTDDLARVGRIVIAGGMRVVCGSAGLVSHLALRGDTTERKGMLVEHADTPTLVVVGSAHPMARRQLERLEQALGARAIVLHSAPVEELESAVRQLREYGCAILAGPEPEARVRGAKATARMLGLAAAKLDAVCRIGRAIVVGGETTWSVFRQLRIDAFRTAGRVEAGMPVVVSNEAFPRYIALKPGSLGHPETLVNAARVLRASRVAMRMEEP